MLQTYHLLSERWFTHASPTLFNAGTPRPQLSSCFLICMKGDSIEVREAAPSWWCVGIFTYLWRLTGTLEELHGLGFHSLQ